MQASLIEHPLERYPKLWAWYRKSQAQRLTEAHEVLLLSLARALALKGRATNGYWIQSVDAFMRTSSNHLNDYILADSLCQELGAPITQILADLAEMSLVSGYGPTAFNALQSLASKTNLSSVRFLTAWIALNNGDLKGCIDECELEHEPHSTIHTLLGQALLESGKPDEAIDALLVAVRLDASDPLPHFQIVKACLVTETTELAIIHVEKCRGLCGDNIEVECLAGLTTIADKCRDQAFAIRTLTRLLEYFERDPGNLDLFCLVLSIQQVLKDQDSISGLFYRADFQILSQHPKFHFCISDLLRKLEGQSWFGLIKILTDRLLACGAKHSQLA
ncbi:MAG: hypothetical protein NTV34_18885 [Proteobacteria bacterium]|nr:hypothetical protein [Pseudomonadota bacterium]